MGFLVICRTSVGVPGFLWLVNASAVLAVWVRLYLHCYLEILRTIDRIRPVSPLVASWELARGGTIRVIYHHNVWSALATLICCLAFEKLWALTLVDELVLCPIRRIHVAIYTRSNLLQIDLTLSRSLIVMRSGIASIYASQGFTTRTFRVETFL